MWDVHMDARIEPVEIIHQQHAYVLHHLYCVGYFTNNIMQPMFEEIQILSLIVSQSIRIKQPTALDFPQTSMICIIRK